MNKKITPAAIAITLLLPLAGQAATSTDNASDAAYSGGNYAGLNGGSGFGAFTVTAVNNQPPYSGTFTGDAASSEGGNGNDGSIDSTGAKAFGFYANGGSTASVTISRGFTTGLHNPGDSFSLDFVPGYNDAGYVGVSLSSGAATVGDFRYQSGGPGFLFNTASTGQGFATGPIHLTYSVTGANTYSLAATGAITFNSSGTFSSPLTGFNVFQTNSGSGDAAHDGFFNNLSVTNIAPTPEPGGLVTLLLGTATLGGVVVTRRRRGLSA